MADKDYDIEIEEEIKHSREGVSSKTGEPFKLYYQNAYLNIGRKNDIEIHIPLAQTQTPFIKGYYKFKGKNALLTANEYRNIQIKREYAYGSEMFPIELVEKK